MNVSLQVNTCNVGWRVRTLNTHTFCRVDVSPPPHPPTYFLSYTRIRHKKHCCRTKHLLKPEENRITSRVKKFKQSRGLVRTRCLTPSWFSVRLHLPTLSKTMGHLGWYRLKVIKILDWKLTLKLWIQIYLVGLLRQGQAHRKVPIYLLTYLPTYLHRTEG
jgi:hypothetical protein